jgi:two-component sensor histidine kinase
MFIPLIAHGFTVGTAIFAYSDSGRHHSEADLALAVELGRRAGLAVLHARQYEALQDHALRLREMTEHQRVLINELNHRVKNTLAIVQAMATQTLRTAATPELGGKAFTARLMALSGAHDILTRDNWEGADIAEIVGELARTHQAEGTRRFRIDGVSHRVAPRLALSLAMTLHELATNATKYGALSNDAGYVEIAWRVEPGDEPTLSMRWQEVDGPPVAVPSRRGFGSRLIERQLGSEPGGTVAVRYEPGGVVCEMTVVMGRPAAAP